MRVQRIGKRQIIDETPAAGKQSMVFYTHQTSPMPEGKGDRSIFFLIFHQCINPRGEKIDLSPFLCPLFFPFSFSLNEVRG